MPALEYVAAANVPASLEMFLEWLGIGWFLVVGICGCIYPFLVERDKKHHKPFHKSQDMFTDGDNT